MYGTRPIQVLTVGRLVWEKAYDRLIRVHKRLLDEGIEHTLTIIGEGLVKSELEHLISNLGVESHCKLLGAKDNPYPYMEQADIFVSSSVVEGLPGVVIESMILEKPIVATNIMGSNELLKSQLGLLVENSEEGLYSGLKQMIQQEELRKTYINNLRDIKQFPFDKEIVLEQLKNLFKKRTGKEKVKLLFVMTNMLLGGAERALANLLESLDYNYYEVDLLLLTDIIHPSIHIDEHVRVRSLYPTYEQFWKAYIENEFDLILPMDYDYQIGFLGATTADIITRYGNPKAVKIGWVHGAFEYSIAGYNKEKIYEIYNRLDKIICVSNGVKETVKNYLGATIEPKALVIYNMFDSEKIRMLAKEKINDLPKIYTQYKEERVESYVNNFVFKKNIVFLMYNLQPSGVTKSLINLLESLLVEGYQVKVLVCVRVQNEVTLPIVPQYLYRTEQEVWDMIGDNQVTIPLVDNYDQIIAYDGFFSAWLSTHFTKVDQKIAWLHAGYKESHKGFEISYVKNIYDQIDLLICVSEDVKHTYQAELNIDDKKMRVVYSCTNAQAIRSLSKQGDFNKKGMTIVSIGRLVPEKGFESLIRVHKRLMDEGMIQELVILGEGYLEGQLTKLIKDLKVEETCKLLGYQDNPYVIMNKADMIVSASYGEGLPLTIMEAMILHKPIVATHVLGNRELLKNGLGMLVEGEEGLYKGIKEMIMDENLRMQYTNRLKQVKSFPFEANKIQTKIEELFGNKKKILFVMYIMGSGGAEQALLHTLRIIDYSKYEVDLIVLGKEKGDMYIYPPQVNVHYIYNTYSEVDQNYAKLQLPIQKQYDVAIAYLDVSTLVCINRHFDKRTTKIAWVHGSLAYLLQNNPKEWLKEQYRQMDQIVCVSQDVQSGFIQTMGPGFERKLKVIYNPMNSEDIQNKSNEKYTN